ncbi:type II toxin-antitoxin system RelE/ParE family toxin [Sorangium sp. So ce291]|uniref:type II toxin-antitoxin system RelE/ParE family toxin n=1 Tax=Sorangium sp. So ce291 TaxID=3133294 RepID=UPI003F605C22
MAVVWTERSRDDLVDIFRFIALDDRKAAERWTVRLVKQAELAAMTPFGGRVVPELGRDDVREVFLRSYRIIYRVAGDDIRILTVFEGHRRLRLDEIEKE